METNSGNIFLKEDMNTKLLENRKVAVIGYGNQGRAQALNMRDSGVKVIIGNQEDEYYQRALSDGFNVCNISEAVDQSHIVFLLIPDENLPNTFDEEISQYLKPKSVLVFASGYSIAFDQLNPPENVDVLLIAPRMIGVGVRERYLTKEGFYCFVGVHQDVSGTARDLLLELTDSISGFYKPAIEVTFKQEATLDLFNEQAFGPAFGRVLLTSIQVLIDKGLPPEAVLVEMYMSEEMAYTYQKMAQVGLVRQTYYHSQTSQYGAMSRGIRFLDNGLKDKMIKIYDEIENGSFAREWSSPLGQLKYQAVRFFAMRQKINSIERFVRTRLGLPTKTDHPGLDDINQILKDPRIKSELKAFDDTFEF